MTALARKTAALGSNWPSQPTALLVDMTGIPNGPALFAEAGMDAVSLFSGADAILLAAEAPTLAYPDWTDADHRAAALRALEAASALGLHLPPGHDLTDNATRDALRRHWRKWLSVHPEKGRDLVMFRFQDPRVFAALAATLLPHEVEALMGPLDAISLLRGDTVTTWSRPSHFEPPADSLRLGNGTFHTMRPEQVQAMREVVSETLKDDLFRFYRTVFAAETEDLGDDDLRGRIEQAIADTQRMGSTREQDVIRMSSVRILRPDIANDEWIWEQVMTHETQDPKFRSTLFQLYLKSDLTPEDRQTFDARMGVFGVEGVY